MSRTRTRTRTRTRSRLRNSRLSARFNLALGALLLPGALSCAPTLRTETRTVLSTKRRPLNDCRKRTFARATAVRNGVLIVVAEQSTCRRGTLVAQQVRTDVHEHPSYVMWTAEFGVGMFWLYLMSQADDLGSGLVAAMFTPFGIGGLVGFVVDIGDFNDETSIERETEVKQLRVEREPVKPAQNLPISLELSDRRTAKGTTNSRGRAFIELPEDMLVAGRSLTLTLRAGTLIESVTLVVPEQP